MIEVRHKFKLMRVDGKRRETVKFSLSTEASMLLGSLLSDHSTVITYAMLEYGPSPEMQVALDELWYLGLVTRDAGKSDMSAKAVRWRLSDEYPDVSPVKAWYKLEEASHTLPRLRVFVKIGEK